jgi:hypothetical protein
VLLAFVSCVLVVLLPQLVSKMTEARAETMVKVVFVVFINRTLLKIILQKLYSFQSCMTRKRRRGSREW